MASGGADLSTGTSVSRNAVSTDSGKSPQVLLIQLLTRVERSVTRAFLRLIPADQSLSECYSHVDLEVQGTLPVYDASRIEAQTLQAIYSP